MRKEESSHPLLWPLILLVLIGVIAAGWYWAGSSNGGIPVSQGGVLSRSQPIPVAGTGSVPILNHPAAASDDAVAPSTRQPPSRDATAAPVTQTSVSQAEPTASPITTIKEEVKNPTPEELAAIPPPPEAAAAMKAGPPPDILRGMQNPPLHMLQGLKNPPPEFNHALNPGGSPPAPAK